MRPIDADAALKALMDAVKSVGVLDADDIKTVFDALPTIQPETPCYLGSPCEYQNPDVVISQPEPQWIPVSERMPRDGTWNIFTDGRDISVERYKEDAIDHFFPNGRWFQLEDATAWMPLPEAYKPNK